MPSVAEVFSAARRLDGEERARYLDEACAGDAALRAEVESLLKEVDGAPEVDTHAVARTVHEAAARTEGGAEAPPEPLPDRIGPFRIVRVLGEGGMGTVYEAEQVELIKRTVALKVIKRGMDSSDVLARFEMERQALSVMDHPHVARVLDVGSTDDGRPWFAMEMVAGESFTSHCDRERLTTRERLELFRDACEAVQHAHQKGVIHRDLKPSNILVAQRDGHADLKVIDFGIAKAMGAALSERALETRDGHVLGTPAYMSPEQAEGSRLDVDTRTDVYSLGVVLYELLTGRLPFDSESTSAREWLEKLASGKTTPPIPSSRVSTLQGEKAENVAHARRVTLPALSKELRGDLDWIVLRAMDPDRNRRYESVSGLAADVQRHLDDEPVEARPPTMGYRLRKFVRRHRVGVAMGSALGLTLVVLIVALAWQSLRLAHQRDVARTAQQDAEREAEASRRVSEFLVSLFELADPFMEEKQELSARELLDHGAQRIEHELKDQPLIRAKMMVTLGAVYRGMGLNDRAEPLLREALDIRRKELEPGHPDVANALRNLSILLMAKGDFQHAVPLAEESVAILRKVADPDVEEFSASVTTLGSVRYSARDLEGARQAFEEALAFGRKNQLNVQYELNNLANVLQDMDRQDLQGALPLREEALAIARKELGPDHPNLATILGNLGALHQQMGHPQEARPLLEEALAMLRRTLGPEHPYVAGRLGSLGGLLTDMGDPAGARPLLEESLAINRKALGPDHPGVVSALQRLANLHGSLGDMPDVLSNYEAALEIQRRTFGPEHPEVARTLQNFGVLLREMGAPGARPRFEEALRINRKAFGPEHPEVARLLNSLAAVAADAGDLKGARPLYEEALAIRRKALGPDSPLVANTLTNLGNVLLESKDLKGARPLYEEALAIRSRTLGPDAPDTGSVMGLLGRLLRESGDLKEARPLLERALAFLRKARPPGHLDLSNPMGSLGLLCRDEGDLKAAEPLLREALEIRGKSKIAKPSFTGFTKEVRDGLADVLRRTGRNAEADALVGASATSASAGAPPP